MKIDCSFIYIAMFLLAVVLECHCAAAKPRCGLRWRSPCDKRTTVSKARSNNKSKNIVPPGLIFSISNIYLQDIFLQNFRKLPCFSKVEVWRFIFQNIESELKYLAQIKSDKSFIKKKLISLFC